MREFLDFSYFKAQDNGNDLTYGILNCIHTRLLKILLNQPDITVTGDILELFLEDLNCFVTASDSSIKNQGLLDGYEPKYKELFQLHYYTDKGQAALAKISAFLEQGKFIFLHTFNSRVPFYIGFKGYEAPVDDISSHHILLIHYENDMFYYAEAPWMLNNENFVRFRDSESIGSIHNNDLLPAAGVFCNYIVLEQLNMNKLNLLKGNLNEYMNLQKKVYFQGSSETTHMNSNTFAGKKAIERLITAYTGKVIHFADEIINDRTIGLNYLIYTMVMRRKRLIKALEYSNEDTPFSKEELIAGIELSIKSWEALRSYLMKAILRKGTVNGDSIKDYLLIILEKENRLFESY